MKKAVAHARAQRLHDIDDRSRACHDDLQALGIALRATAARARKGLEGSTPLRVVEDDITFSTKVARLRESSKRSPG